MTEIVLPRKTTNLFTVTITNNGSVQNITGWTVFFTVKKSTNQTDAEALISKTITTHTNPTLGITTITLSPSDTDVLAGNYLYDITLLDTTGNRYAAYADSFIILDYITQRSV